MPETPTFVEPLEDRLLMSTTRHHFYTGVRAHYTVTPVIGHTRHHYHTGVRARSTGTTSATSSANPPAAFGTLPTVTGSGTGTGVNTLLGTGNGIFGGSTAGLFGGTGTVFA